MKGIIVFLILVSMLMLASCKPTYSTPASTQPQAIATDITASPSITDTDASLYEIEDFFPVLGNIYMKYEGSGNEYAGYETYVDYIKNQAIQIRDISGGTTVFSVYVIEDGALKKVYSEGEESYYRIDRTGMRNTEDILIMEPIEVGTSWTRSDGSQTSITSVNTPVDVPYGRFEALEITTLITAEPNSYTLTAYYAPGVGLIKKTFASNDMESLTTSELAEVKSEVPQIQNMRIYYPKSDNEELAFVESSAELYTGTDISDIFENRFKNAPQDLNPTMSENSDILDLDYDRQAKIVRINFSPEFASEMSPDSITEGLTLKAIANTLGLYFMTDKVDIRLDGMPYKSEHFTFREGEYLTVDLIDMLIN